MKNYVVTLQTGQVINVQNGTFDAVAFTDSLNDNRTLFVNIGGAIVNKHLIQTIVPQDAVAEE